MKSKVLTLLLMLAAFIPALNAQQAPQGTPLPLNPQVKAGVLPNGLSYYILHNEEPKNRANFYIAQKVGSTLEQQDQLGLAHFLEHMAFNGTSHYPGKNMLNYLQNKGIRFGADINAYTSFDETVYNINNVPCNDKALMDSVLLVLYDWSGSILLEESEIDAERGVIQEEWRSRNDAQTRFYTQMLPAIYDEYQYQQMPIGKMDVVMNFKPEVLRAYYKKWYRPDQQGIVIVGDFDAAEMEQKVKDLFSSIPMPENAAPRTYPDVSDNKEPIYFAYEDPETRNDMCMVMFKYDKTPFELRNTVEAYMQDVLMLDQVIAGLINNRLQEYAKEASCKYSFALVSFGDYTVSKTKGAVTIYIIPKSDNTLEAVSDAMAVVARACKTGFTDSELERVDSEILANYEKLYNERDKTDSEDRAREIIRHFVDNEPSPGIETEYQLAQQALPMINAQVINEVAKSVITTENQVVVVNQHQAEGRTLPTKEAALAAVNNAINAEYEAFVDEVITDPLIAALPQPGAVVSESDDAAFGTHEFVLSNGAKVILKTTDFAADEVRLQAIKKGGMSSYPADQAVDVLLAGDAYEASILGPFNSKQLTKYLAGKKVSLGFDIANQSTSLEGSSTVKDLPTLMELIYASFTNLNPDPETFATEIGRARSIMVNQEKNPMFKFMQILNSTLWNGNPMKQTVSVAMLDAANYDKSFKIVKNATANAADYTFVITGNVDVAALTPLINQYIATLPSTGKTTEAPVVNPLEYSTTSSDNYFQVPMETPAVYVSGAKIGNMEYNTANIVRMPLVGEVLDIIYTATLREEIGGTYGASCGSNILPWNGQSMIQYFFQTGPDTEKQLIDRAKAELDKLLNEGTDADHFNKVKGAALAQYDNKVRTNDFWVNTIVSKVLGYDTFTGYKEYLDGLTLENFNDFLKKLTNSKANLLIVEEGAAQK